MRLLKVQAARGNCLAAAGVYFFLPRVVGEFLSCDDGGTHAWAVGHTVCAHMGLAALSVCVWCTGSRRGNMGRGEAWAAASGAALCVCVRVP